VRAEGLQGVETWVVRHKAHWTAALDRLEALAASRTAKRRKS
jgi:hypothetical protein